MATTTTATTATNSINSIPANRSQENPSVTGTGGHDENVSNNPTISAPSSVAPQNRDRSGTFGSTSVGSALSHLTGLGMGADFPHDQAL